MACGVDGSIANPSTCSANAGDQISLEHREWPDASRPGAIDVSHKGNTAIYMKKISSQSDEVTSDGWFKIYFDGYDSSTGEWGTDHMNSNGGLVTTTIPSDLASGNYLVRSEVLALQEVGEPQMYIGCAQISLSGTGSAVPADTATIPGYIDMSTPAMTVNIYESFKFTEYGPKLYGSGGNGNGTVTTSTASRATSSSKGGLASSSSSGISSTSTTSSVSNSINNVASTTNSGAGAAYDDVDKAMNDDDTISEVGQDDDGSSGHYHQGGHRSGSNWRRWSAWNHGGRRASRSIFARRYL